MARYIDAEDAVEVVYRALRSPSKDYRKNPFHDSMPLAVAMVNEIPAADVRENVRGEWEWRYDDENGRPVYGCSFCNGMIVDAENKEYVFCPYCGADMRKKGEE